GWAAVARAECGADRVSPLGPGAEAVDTEAGVRHAELAGGAIGVGGDRAVGVPGELGPLADLELAAVGVARHGADLEAAADRDVIVDEDEVEARRLDQAQVRLLAAARELGLTLAARADDQRVLPVQILER